MFKFLFVTLEHKSNRQNMKHKGSVMEYTEERISHIMSAYDNYISSCRHISIPYICKHISEMPAKRFWVSDIWASKVITAMMRGKFPYYKMRPLKKEMFEEIYRRVVLLLKENPTWTISKCCSIVVAQPAPKHYLSEGTIRVMICKMRKRRNEERLKKLLR